MASALMSSARRMTMFGLSAWVSALVWELANKKHMGRNPNAFLNIEMFILVEPRSSITFTQAVFTYLWPCVPVLKLIFQVF